LKIVHVSTYDVTGGAARAAYRLHRHLYGLGHDSSMLVLHRHSDDATVTAFAPPGDVATRVRRRLRRWRIRRGFARYQATRPSGVEKFSDDRSAHGAAVCAQLPRCDVVNLHWVAGFIDYRDFFGSAPDKASLVWRLADMNPFTGGCHYDEHCRGFERRCGACPQLGSHDARDLARRIWDRKWAILERVPRDRLNVVTPSRWLAGEAQRSPILGRFSITTIPNGVDVDSFAPRDRYLARDVLRIPRDARVLLFVADALGNPRKGFPALAEAIEGLRKVEGLLLLSVGRGEPPREIGVPHLQLGHITNDRLLSLVYSAADVCAIPSRHDNFPSAVLESLACGTPVVGFAVGGIPEMVRTGATGWLVPPGNVAAFRDAIAQLLEDRVARDEMAVKCRRRAVEEYRLETQAGRYVELYRRMCRR
ncbi:MAG: glycosyltransferase family 4 protein, partial [Candidatus Rokuibacteriota bacterium]